jgi:hypothetical protein
MNQESQAKAYNALGALEAWIESAVQAEIEGSQAALANFKTLEAEFVAVSTLARTAHVLFNA